jgi:autotransporter strand-loop-strand O-heptosyltransferase
MNEVQQAVVEVLHGGPKTAARPPAPGSEIPEVADIPTQEGPNGIRFDFNDGCRVVLPPADYAWRVRLSDIDTGNILYETEIKAGSVNSSKRYFVRFRLEVWQRGQKLVSHDYSAADRDVLIRFPVETLGDTIAWLPYAVRFGELHKCRLTCAISGKLIPLFRDAYPEITFVTADQVDTSRFYASYTVVLFFKGGVIYDYKDRLPCDFRFVGLQRAAAYILGVDPAETPPRLALPDASRPIPERYVCIAVQSTMQSKYWNNPTGWWEIVDFLKNAGYRVIGIDQKRSHGNGMTWTHLPDGAEDQTGDKPLVERARWLKHADFFVGLSSGLSWLAWAVGTPVVMISGVSHPRNEFTTPYRVINYHTCNSCWNDPLADFNRDDFFTCPRHKGTPRQFECTRLITADQVKAVIKTVPSFGPRAANDQTVDRLVPRRRYRPEIFDAADMQRAKQIVLTNEGPGDDTETRWRTETPYLMKLLSQNLQLRSEMTILDYGCGVGRMAKAIIDAASCRVIGIDISENMRRLAENYVQSDQFVAVSPRQFDSMVRGGLRAHAAIAIWVLQHCLKPVEDIARIRNGIGPDGAVFVLNMFKRAVPAMPEIGGRFFWAEDGLDVANLLRKTYQVQAEGIPDHSSMPAMAEAGSYWMYLRQRGG